MSTYTFPWVFDLRDIGDDDRREIWYDLLVPETSMIEGICKLQYMMFDEAVYLVGVELANYILCRDESLELWPNLEDQLVEYFEEVV